MKLKHLHGNGDIEIYETIYEPLGVNDARVEWRLSLESTYGLNRSISTTSLSFIRNDREWLMGIFNDEGAVAMVWAEIFDVWWVLDFSTVEMTPEYFKASFESPAIDLTKEVEIEPLQRYAPLVRAETLTAKLETFNSSSQCTFDMRDSSTGASSFSLSMPNGMGYSSTTDTLGECSLKPTLDDFETTYTNYITDPTGETSGVRYWNWILYSYLKDWDNQHNTQGLHTDGWQLLLGGNVPSVEARDGLLAYEIAGSNYIKQADFQVLTQAKVRIAPNTITTRTYKFFIVIAGFRTIERGTMDRNEMIETVDNELLDFNIYGISPVINMSTTEQRINFNTTMSLNIIDILNNYAFDDQNERYHHYVKSMQKNLVAIPIMISPDATAGTYVNFFFEADYTLKTNMRKTVQSFWGEPLMRVLNKSYTFTSEAPELNDVVLSDLSLQMNSDPVKVTLSDILSSLSGLGYGFLELAPYEVTIMKIKDLLTYPRQLEPLTTEGFVESISSGDGKSLVKVGYPSEQFSSTAFQTRECSLFGARTPTMELDLTNMPVETNGFKLYKAIQDTSKDKESMVFMFDLGNTGSTENTYLLLNGRWTNARRIKNLIPLETGFWTNSNMYYWKGSPASEITVDADGLVVNEGASIPATTNDIVFVCGEYKIKMPLRDATPLFSGIRNFLIDNQLYFPISIEASDEPQTVEMTAKRYADTMYTITPIQSENITFYPNTPQSVQEMHDCSFRVSAHAGYEIEWLLIDNRAIRPSAATQTTYTFYNVRADHTIGAKSAPLQNLNFTAQEDTVLSVIEHNYPKYAFKYSFNGTNWYDFPKGGLLIHQDEKVFLKGSYDLVDAMNYVSFKSTKPIYASGDIMSLVGGGNVIYRDFQFYKLFEGMDTLLTSPALPAVKLTNYCYAYMFSGCTNLREMPYLPSDSMFKGCYDGMFLNCTTLTMSYNVTAQPADYGCHNQFNGCTNLTDAGDFISINTAPNCYSAMYANCGSLVQPPMFMGNTTSKACYYYMFGDTMLQTAPNLDAEVLSDCCYYSMFENTYLTKAPTLPALTLTPHCYRNMFDNCIILNNIECLATNIDATKCTEEWVCNVSGSGTFTKNQDMQKWTVGDSGIPKDWEVVDK